MQKLKRTQISTDYRKNLVIFLIMLIFLLMFFCFFLGYNFGTQKISDKADQRLNNYFTVIYDNEVGPKGDQLIKEIVNKTLKIDSTDGQLNYIAERIWENFTNPYYDKFPYLPINPISKGYNYDLNGDLRLLESSKYYNDPKWIAYYKTGACGELAILFSEIANQSGYPTRTIYAEQSGGGTHGWSEVLINDEWWYFDPAFYADYHKNGLKMQYKWFNLPQNHPWIDGNIREIFVLSTNEDRISKYLQPKKTQPKIPRFGEENFGSLLIEKYILPSIELMTQKNNLRCSKSENCLIIPCV